MIGFELRWLGWDMDITDHCARSKGNLNRNPYCSWSHSIPFSTMKRNESKGEMGLWVALSGICDCWLWLLWLCRCVCSLIIPICVVIVFTLFVFSVICLYFHESAVHGIIEYCVCYVLFIIVWLDKRSLVDWYILFLRLLNQVFYVVCSCTCEGSSLSVPNDPLRNPTINCNSIPLTITYHNPLLIVGESRIRV